MANLVELIVKAINDTEAGLAEAVASVDVATKEMSGKFKTLSKDGTESLASLGKMVGILSGASGLLSMVGPIGAVGVAFGAFGALAAPTLIKVKDAITATGTAGKKAWKDLDPTERGIADNIKDLEKNFDNLSKAFAPTVEGVLKLASGVAQDLFPAMKVLAPVGADLATDFLDPLGKFLQSQEFHGFVTDFADLAKEAGPGLATTLGDIGTSLSKLLIALGPNGVKAIDNLGPALANLISNGAEPLAEDFSDVFNWIEDIAKHPLTAQVAAGLVGALVALKALKTIKIGVQLVGAAAQWISKIFSSGSGTTAEIGASAMQTAADTMLTASENMQRAADTMVGADTAGGRAAAGGAAAGDIAAGDIAGGAAGATAIGAGAAVGSAALAGVALGIYLKKFIPQMNARVQTLWNAGISPKMYGAQQMAAQLTVNVKGNITDLQTKLAEAKKLLTDPNLTKTQTAQLKADISQLEAQIAKARAELDALNGKTAYTYVITSAVSAGGHGPGHPLTHAAGGVIGGAASGGARNNLTMVGEYGPELVSLPTGSYVHSNPDTQRMLRPGGSGGDTYVFNFPNYVGSSEDLIRVIRKNVRTKGGGNVQAAFGSAA